MNNAGPSNAVANFDFTFDAIGNLTQRKDLTQSGGGLVETFTYDNLNRLKTYNTTGSSAVSKSVAYNDIGNITSKSDVGLYTYPAAAAYRPHAVTATSGGVFRPSTTYVYDQNGNMTSSAGRTVTWNSFNKVASIAQGTTSVAYVYGPDHQRVKETTTVSGSTTITHYFGVSPAGVNFEFVDGPTQDTWNDYLYAGGEMVGVQKRVDGGAVQSTRYFVKDHLGSIAVLTTETGVVAERLGTVRNLVRGAIEVGRKEPNYGDREGYSGPATLMRKRTNARAARKRGRKYTQIAA